MMDFLIICDEIVLNVDKVYEGVCLWKGDERLLGGIILSLDFIVLILFVKNVLNLLVSLSLEL